MLKSFNLMIVKAMALALVMCVGAIGVLYLDNQAKAESVATLTLEKNLATGQLAQMRLDLAANQELLSAQRLSDRRVIAQVNRLLEEIDNAAPEANGPVAPVLADALVAINGMWDDAGYERAADTADRTSEPLPKPPAPVRELSKPTSRCVRSDESDADADFLLVGR